MTVLLDSTKLNAKETAHPYLKEVFSFPDYYGANLDALYDMLTMSGPVRVLIEDPGKLCAYGKRVFRVMKDAAEENPVFDLLNAHHYRLFALDVDGTLLDHRKNAGEKTVQAVGRLAASGIQIVFNTGRSLAEMTPVQELFPSVRYSICASGGFIWDNLEKKCLFRKDISMEDVDKLFETIRGRDVMPAVFSNGEHLANRDQIGRLSHYGMATFVNTIPPISLVADDVYEELRAGRTAEKINLYHTDPAEREISRARLAQLKPDLEIINAETSSLECSPRGVDKGYGLKILAQVLDIPLSDTIMAGDNDNDLPGIMAAGLRIVMGNAQPHVKEAADLVIGDSDHDGMGDFIESFFGV